MLIEVRLAQPSKPPKMSKPLGEDIGTGTKLNLNSSPLINL